MLNSSLIPHIKKCSLKGDGVVVFIHKSLNCKIIHDLSKSNGIVETVKRKKSVKAHSLRSVTIFGNCKSFKNVEKCFLFHLKSFFRSQDI